MSKENVLEKVEQLKIVQANNLSLKTEGSGGKKMVVMKTIDGEGYTGTLTDLINDFYALSFQDREWIIANFYSINVQAMGGQPNCPC